MKILAIRGENLASLFGPFQLPLDRPPIDGAGLFSISGPTGAGKSTLLDALCLALYGKTPRLKDRGAGVLVGRAEDEQRLDANDARGLVSRGAASARAEVDYEGVDGKRYRATWRVHRARNRLDGTLQNQQLTLADLATGEVIADRSQAVRENERRVGFSFEEFKRAVVLPQFEFTNFLRATAGERAEILERVTGTEVYSRLSQAAYQRGEAEARGVAELTQRLAEHPVLTDDARRELLARRAQLEHARAEASEAAQRAARAIDWHDRAALLAREQAEAEAARAAAAAALAAAGPLRAELAAVEEAEAHRPAVEAEVRARAARDAAAGGRARAADALAGAARTRDEAARREAEARARAAAAEAARVEAGPALAEARRLDGELAAALRAAAQAEEARTATAREAAAAEAEAGAAAAAVAAAEAERARTAAWLAGRAAERPLAEGWNRWEPLLRDHAAAVAAQDEAARTGAALAAQGAAAEERAREAAAALERAEAELRAHADAARAADRAAAEADPARCAAALEAARGRREALAELFRQARAHAQAEEAAGAAERQAGRAEAEGEAARAARDEADRAAAGAEGARAAAARVLQRLALALGRDVAELRHALADGEPCPVCGAREHPYAAEAPARSALDATRAELEAAEAAAREATAARERAGARAAECAAEAKAARAQGAARRREAEEAAEAYRLARGQLGAEDAGAPGEQLLLGAAPAVPAGPAGAAPALEALGKVAARALRDAEAAQAEAHRRADEARARAGELEEARRARDAAKDAQARAADAARDAAELLARRAEEAARRGRERDRLEAELAPALSFLAGWSEAARTDGPAFLARCAALARAHAEADAALAALAARRGTLEADRAAARSRADERAARARGAEEAARAARAAAEAAQGARAAVLGGAPADAVEARLREAVEDAGGAKEAERAALGAAAEALAAAAREAEGAAEALARAEVEATAAGSRVLEVLAALGIDRAVLDGRLGRGRAWIAARRAELEGLARAADRAETALAERRRQAEAHAASGRPAGTADDARRAREEAKATEDAAAADLSDVQLSLRRDDESRSAHAGLAAELAKRGAAAERWGRLSALIGSADGKKLRVFAQGLALDALLREANRQLEDLTHRYALARVPGADLELQVVDRDLGDEVRTVNGLSGGELFLVSLALALGLASLSTRATVARTLFIDEGFGTLDRDTLERAMAALEGLRAGGRTIGVISHVPELHERIGVRVTVERVSAGRSRVVLPG